MPVAERGPQGSRTILCLAYLFCSIAFGSNARAQSIDLSNLSISNQFEYSLEKDTNDEILEDWFDLRYQTDPFSFGARFEVFQPSERSAGSAKNLPPDSTFQDVSYRYVEFQRNGVRITAGNFYDIFGRGIAFRSYENRDVRIDTSLDGIRIGVQKDIFDFKLLTGKMLDKKPSGIPQERFGLLHAANLEARLSDRLNTGPLQNVLLGSSVSRISNSSSTDEIVTGRVEFGFNRLFFYGEMGDRIGEPGSAVYLGTNLDLFGVGLLLEYKKYDQFDFHNNPPALTREHTYTLLSRNAYSMDANNEQGYQVEASYLPVPMNTLLFNYSRTESYTTGKVKYEEVYGEWSRYQGDKLYGVLAFASQVNEGIHSYIPVAELEYYLNDRNSIRAEIQHQHQKGTAIGEFDVDLLVAEYARSPHWTISFMGERDNRSDLQRWIEDIPDKNVFLSGQVNLHLSENQDLMVFYGSRQKGRVCVGGVCRTEPEFEGLEVKLFSKF